MVERTLSWHPGREPPHPADSLIFTKITLCLVKAVYDLPETSPSPVQEEVCYGCVSQVYVPVMEYLRESIFKDKKFL